MMRNLKAVFSLFLIVCLMVGFVPEAFIASVGESMHAQAETRNTAGDSRPVSDELESSKNIAHKVTNIS